jgi:site-specific recombinase XerD
MATTKAVIRKNRLNEKGLTPIYIRYTHNQDSILFAVGELVNPVNWDDVGFIKKSMRGYSNFNALIEKKKRTIDDLRIGLQLTDIEPTVTAVRDAHDRKYKKIDNVPAQSPYFLDHWDRFVDYQINVTKISSGTARQYTAAKSRLLHFEKENRVRLTFDKIERPFYESYLYYLYTIRNCASNTVGNQVKYVKAYMNWCTTKERLTTNLSYKEFVKPKSTTQIFTLNQGQLDKLFAFDLSSHKRLARVRDMFCLCCTTGLRYSDAKRLQQGNIKDDHIIINTKKTSDTAIIPLNDYSKEIISRYSKGLPKISHQNMNDYLKELGELTELNEEQEVISFKGGFKSIEIKPFYELMTTHMGRRTFITQSLERGMLPSTVMKISTHKDYKSFNLYINTTQARIRQEVKNAWNTPRLTYNPTAENKLRPE